MALRFTPGAKSLRPFLKAGSAYSALPLKRRLESERRARALTLGLGLERSLRKVLMAILAKAGLVVL